MYRRLSCTHTLYTVDHKASTISEMKKTSKHCWNINILVARHYCYITVNIDILVAGHYCYITVNIDILVAGHYCYITVNTSSAFEDFDYPL